MRPVFLHSRFMPILPGRNCPGQSTVSESCGSSNTARHWIWSPVSYRMSSASPSPSAITTPAGNWNGIQSKLELDNASNPLDIFAYDFSVPGIISAQTLSYGQDCNPDCFNRPNQCTGQ